MKLFLATAALATALAVPAFAQTPAQTTPLDNQSSNSLEAQTPAAKAKAKASGTVGASGKMSPDESAAGGNSSGSGSGGSGGDGGAGSSGSGGGSSGGGGSGGSGGSSR